MADRIIKSDSGNDTVIQNNSGSRKIEVTNSGDVEVTGDFKATTVKATNIKANDGTASLEIADSSGDIGFSGNTNLKLKLPSAGGLYESDGSTEILTESSGVVTLKNTTLDQTSLSNGMVVKSGVKKYTDGDHGKTSLGIEAALTYHQITCSVGNTIIFTFNGRVKFGATASTTRRAGSVYAYQHTSSVSEGATSGLGSELANFYHGITLISASSTEATGHYLISLNGAFVATSTTHYLGFVYNLGSADNNAEVVKNASTPMVLNYLELKGDVIS